MDVCFRSVQPILRKTYINIFSGTVYELKFGWSTDLKRFHHNGEMVCNVDKIFN